MIGLMNIPSEFNIGDILYNQEREIVAYLVERRFVGIKNYSYQEAKEVFSPRERPLLETWYYKFKCVGSRSLILQDWISEPALSDLLEQNSEWKIQRKGG